MPKNRGLISCLEMAKHHAEPSTIGMIIMAAQMDGEDLREILGDRMGMITNNICGAISRVKEIKAAADAGDIEKVRQLIAVEDISCTS
jgi:hypothetical protein